VPHLGVRLEPGWGVSDLSTTLRVIYSPRRQSLAIKQINPTEGRELTEQVSERMYKL